MIQTYEMQPPSSLPQTSDRFVVFTLESDRQEVLFSWTIDDFSKAKETDHV